jgi:hypothetical protein
MRIHRSILLSTLALAPVAPANAASIDATSLFVDVFAGTNNPVGAGLRMAPGTDVYVDDAFLTELVFPDVTFSSSGNFGTTAGLEVLTGRNQVNVEWGDLDSASDGDDHGMAKINQQATSQEFTDPAIQDRALLTIFSGLSLTEMTDGEGGATYSFKVAFKNWIRDNNNGVDGVPEIVVFERGRNDNFNVRLITGGTFDLPVVTDPLSISSSSFTDVGFRVNTREIGAPQTLGVGAYDLNDWGLENGETVYGYIFEGTGADMAGIFSSGFNDQFTAPIYMSSPLPAVPGTAAPATSVVPLPPGIALLAGGLAMAGILRRRQGARATA